MNTDGGGSETYGSIARAVTGVPYDTGFTLPVIDISAAVRHLLSRDDE